MPLVSDLATPFSSTSSTRTDSDASAAVVDSHTSASIGPLMYMSSASGAVWYFTLRTSLVLLFSKHGSGTRPSRPASHCEVLIEHRPSFGSRSEEHTSELQSLMRISYAVFCLKKKKNKATPTQ